MTTKVQTAIGAGFATALGFIAFVANTPPSQQTGLFADLLAVIPVAARPQIAAWGKLLSEFSLMYSLFKASRSGPPPPTNQTPPVP